MKQIRTVGTPVLAALLAAMTLPAVAQSTGTPAADPAAPQATKDAGTVVTPSDPSTVQGGATPTGAASDATIVGQVNTQLQQDPQLRDVDIQVEAMQGRVSLKGTAPSQAARDRAEQVATSVQGVSSVDNQIKVGS